MKPAGPERDKVIAEMRGEETVTLDRDVCGVCYSDTPCEECGNHGYKPYSTDIACAMELWEEMFTPQFYNLCTWDLYINGFCPSKSNPKHYFSANIKNKSTGFKHRTGNVRHDTADKAIADVISGAWLKWREGE